MTAAKDLYQILDVGRRASSAEIRKAYKKLAKQHHPDLNPGNKQSEERFKEISVAHQVLSDPEKRKLYDEFGEAALRGGFDPEKMRAYRQQAEAGSGHGRTRGGSSAAFAGGFGGGFGGDAEAFDLGAFFDQFMGGFDGHRGRHGGRGGVPTRGQDVEGIVEIDLAQAISGTAVSLQIPGDPPDEVTVRIPPGADDGSRLRVQGRGMAGTGNAPAGDLIIETRVRPHRYFKRQGLDLFLSLPITIDEAYNGANIEIPTPGGNIVMRIPPRSQNDRRLRLKGRGLTRGKSRGELYVDLKVQMPDKSDDVFGQAAKRSAALYSKPVREDIRL
ncbi:MAG: J domain-containing protein [Deltaproteobacteria bacterium]|nr:J domain-containing protein [Deltaproteobacteria bacterium]